MARHLLIANAVRSADGSSGDAALIEGDRITSIGMATDLRSGDVAEHHYPGATIIPGLRDAHLHPVGYAAALVRPTLKNAPDFAAVADIVADAIRTQDPGSAVTGLRLDDESLAEGRLPDREVLDAVSSEQPILLIRYCGHVAVANSAALAIAGIDHTTPDPVGGSIDRDERGIPTGVLRETAFEPVTAALRPLAPELSPDQIADGLMALASTGLVGVGAMAATDSGLWGGATSELDVLLAASRTSPIPLRIFVIARTPETLREAADRIEAAGSMAGFAGVKMFSDGSFGGHTAAMHEPFADRPGETGTDRLDPEWAHRMATASLAMGGRVAVHAIGDRANGGVLDLMERLIADGADPDDLRIEHASVLTAPDIARFGRLGVTASVQPAFIASEVGWLEKRLGSNRIGLTYPFRSLAAAGAPLAGGSDCPVEPPHPLHGMAAARDRLGLVPDEALDSLAALTMFTDGAARACGFETEGRADLTVVDIDPIEADANDLRTANVLATWVEGSPVPVPTGTIAWQG